MNLQGLQIPQIGYSTKLQKMQTDDEATDMPLQFSPIWVINQMSFGKTELK